MNTDFVTWQHWMLIALIALGAAGLIYRIAGSALSRAQQKKRIVAARVRSGHAPLEMPTTRGDLHDPGSHWADLDAAQARKQVVDERPTIRILYNDMHGKLADRTITVEQLDLHRQVIVAEGNSLYDPRIYPLERIVEARNSQTGKVFNLGQWVDAVRVARRRRGADPDD